MAKLKMDGWKSMFIVGWVNDCDDWLASWKIDGSDGAERKEKEEEFDIGQMYHISLANEKPD